MVETPKETIVMGVTITRKTIWGHFLDYLQIILVTPNLIKKGENMYSTTGNKLRVFDVKTKDNAPTTIFATLSEAEKVGESHGKPVYEYNSYMSRFVGKAFEKAKALKDKDRIEITKWSIVQKYVKEKKRAYVTLTVFDFEHVVDDNETAGADEEEQQKDEFMKVVDDSETPFQ